jgi:hypothetical protein
MDQVMKRYLLTLLFTLGSTTAVVAAEPPRKPNILWVLHGIVWVTFTAPAACR